MMIRRTSRAGLFLVSALALASCAKLAPAPGTPNPAQEQASRSIVQLANATRETGDLAAAVKLYRKALETDPNQPEVLLLLGATLFRGGDYGEAISAYDKAATLAPQHAEPHLGMGRIYLAQQKANQARVEFAAAVERDPKNADAYNDLGVTLDMLGRHQEAQLRYAQGLDLAPDDMALRNNLGLSQAISGDYENAIAGLSKLSLEPVSTPRIRQNLALALGLKGDDKSAEQMLRSDLDPEEVRGNLRYFTALRNLTQGGTAAPPQKVDTDGLRTLIGQLSEDVPAAAAKAGANGGPVPTPKRGESVSQ